MLSEGGLRLGERGLVASSAGGGPPLPPTHGPPPPSSRYGCTSGRSGAARVCQRNRSRIPRPVASSATSASIQRKGSYQPAISSVSAATSEKPATAKSSV